jgi:hypothetical protein
MARPPRPKPKLRKVANPIGRPSLYRPEYCQAVLDDMAAGYSLMAFGGLIGVDRSTLLEWARVHQDFSLAVSRGKALQLRKWETDAHRVAQKGGGPGTATIIMFGLKNMGGEEWREVTRVENTGPDGLPIQTENRTVIVLPGNGRDGQNLLALPHQRVEPEGQSLASAADLTTQREVACKRKQGRPLVGEVAMTSCERSRKSRAARREAADKA